MSKQIIKTLVPPPVRAPRGAVWAGLAAAWLCQALPDAAQAVYAGSRAWWQAARSNKECRHA